MARLSTGKSLSGERPMVTGRAPTGTSFTSFSSNIRLSFAIRSSSCGGILITWPFLTLTYSLLTGAATQPGEPSFRRFIQEAGEDHRNVVQATTFICEFDKFLSRGSGVCFCLQGASDFGLGNHAGEAVGTKEQDVVRKDRDLVHVHFDVGMGTQGAQEDALHFAFFGFLPRDEPAAHLFGDQRVIVC